MKIPHGDGKLPEVERKLIDSRWNPVPVSIKTTTSPFLSPTELGKSHMRSKERVSFQTRTFTLQPLSPAARLLHPPSLSCNISTGWLQRALLAPARKCLDVGWGWGGLYQSPGAAMTAILQLPSHNSHTRLLTGFRLLCWNLFSCHSRSADTFRHTGAEY